MSPFQPQAGAASGFAPILPSGITNYPVPAWELATTGVTPTLNRYEASKLVFAAPTLISRLLFVTSGAATAPTHWWLAIQPAAAFATLSGAGTAVAAVTADQTNTAIAANALVSVAVTAPVTVPAGSYYAGFYFDGTTPPAIMGANVPHSLENLDFIGQGYHVYGAAQAPPAVGALQTLTTAGSAQVFIGTA